MPEDKPDTDFRDTNYRVGFKKYDTYVCKLLYMITSFYDICYLHVIAETYKLLMI